MKKLKTKTVWTVQYHIGRSKSVKKSVEYDNLDDAIAMYYRSVRSNWKQVAIRSKIVSTPDVPGARKSNNDKLTMGCWAEHKDGSLMFVESTENGRVIYSVFDVADPNNPIEYRDAMRIKDFKKTYSWKPNKRDKWTWHDKTPFPWEKIIELGAKDGVRYPSADRLISAAQRVAESRQLKGDTINVDDHRHKINRNTEKAATAIIKGLQKALQHLAN